MPAQMSPARLTVECPPKLNLYLRVVGRRSDGYHELETVFQSVSGGDVLSACPASDLTLATDDRELPTGPENLVLRAAARLRDLAPDGLREKLGAALYLQKRVPVGGGMGGGSADAAGALRLLSQLWDLAPERAALHAAAAALGSDVPFFLTGGCAVATGRGEQLVPGVAQPFWFVLVRPPVPVATPWAYSRWRGDACTGSSLQEFRAALAGGTAGEVAACLRNDLEPGVAAGVPEIAAARDWLIRAGALGARMTGSGSVVFGIARDEEHARAIAAHANAPGRAWVARSLSAPEALPYPRCPSVNPETTPLGGPAPPVGSARSFASHILNEAGPSIPSQQNPPDTQPEGFRRV